MSSATQAYGANIAFIEELYERYRANPESVSASWREFFKENPEVPDDGVDSRHAERSEAPGGAGSAPPVPPRSLAPARDDAVAALRPVPGAPPLRGAAAKIATNMEASLGVPTATSNGSIPVKVLEENRRIINNHL